MKRTTLYTEHKAAGAKMVDFSGWDMPVSYKGILEEHKAVREYAGVFDVSHMGVVDIAGAQALEFLQMLTVNDVSRLELNHSQYTMMLDENGQVLDDMILTRLQQFYRLVVNCSNFGKIIAWMEKQKVNFVVSFKVRDELNILALQGPSAKSILEPLLDMPLQGRAFTVSFNQLLGEPVMISHTGYTGEDGFEIFVRHERVVDFWKAFLAAGATPVGLGARDTLRIEAGLPLYGQEIYGQVTPYDIGYGWIVKLSKPDFIGKSVLQNASQKRRLFGITMQDKVIPRHGVDVLDFGQVTSGTFSPTLGKPIAMFMTDKDIADKQMVFLKIRDKQYPAEVTKLPFIKKKTL